MKPILQIQNISKRFRIRHEKQPYLSIRDSFTSFFKSDPGSSEDFYALKNVSFNVMQGDTVGIIGKNGAGKSTLLKVLSKITPPTSGKIICRGRVASLLEVGTGFHPELSGRENIFLNGSILGMKRTEIIKNFDAIVDFAGIEKFIDTPLKHYSSGMQLRLAFAVAAFLENEILVIDEVLAVGDAEFQKKCMGKMEDVSKSGRTILFVSHNMGAVKTLCNKGVLIKNGELIHQDSMDIVAKEYLINSYEKRKEFLIDYSKLKNPMGYASKVTIEDTEGNNLELISIGQAWQIRVNFTINEQIPHFIIGIGFLTAESVPFRTTWSAPQDISPGNYEVLFRESEIHYGSGKYFLHIGLSSREQTFHYVQDGITIDFDDYVDKSIAPRSNGIILNQMKTHISKIN